MAHDVFISHSSKDKTIADTVCAKLEAHKIRCWIAPRDIAPGATWEKSIVTALAASKVMVLVFSEFANESEQVKREVSLALKKGATVIPFRIEDVDPTDELEYNLSTLHWLDAFMPPLEQHLEYLASRIGALLTIAEPQHRASAARTPRVVGSKPVVSTVISSPKPKPTDASVSSLAFRDSAHREIRINPVDGAEMVYIPASTYLKKKLPAFYIYKTPVTVAQYKQFCRETNWKMPGAPGFNPNWSREDHPIVEVSWNDAQNYCQWAGVRLPTDEEWKKAARGTDWRRYPWGDEWDANKCANSVGQSLDGTVAVGVYTDSPYGLSDMAGNVSQWCANEFDWTGKVIDRVLRGSSWYGYDMDYFRIDNQYGYAPDFRNLGIGFRCASGVDSR